MANWIEKTQLLRGLWNGEVAYAGPFFVDVDLTQRCNLRCLGCRYHSPLLAETSSRKAGLPDMPIELFEQLCADLGAMGTHQVILQGAGEPTLHPQLAQMIATAKDAGMRVTLITNGTLLDEGMVEALMDVQLDTLKVSLWATSPEQYEINYPGCSGETYARVVDNLRRVTRLKAARDSLCPRLEVHYPINSHNADSIDAIVELAHEVGCQSVSFAPFNTVGGALDSYALASDEEGQARLGLVRARERLTELGLRHNIDQVLMRYRLGPQVWKQVPCYITWMHARIRVDGSIQPCGSCDAEASLGNIQRGGFREHWNGPPLRAFRQQARTCEGMSVITQHCHCDFCCYAADNVRVHRVFRYLAPLARWSRA